jgi:hypothetical protein
MRWRRETWILLAWLGLAVGVLWAVSTYGAAGLGFVGCERSDDSIWANPFGPCGDAIATMVLLLATLLVGGIGLLVTSVLWLRARPTRRSCPGCAAPVMPADTRCPTCGRDLGRRAGPPAGWGAPGRR